METKQCYLLAIGFSMTVIWGYLKFCWLMSDFHKYECYNLSPVRTCPGLPYIDKQTIKNKKVIKNWSI